MRKYTTATHIAKLATHAKIAQIWSNTPYMVTRPDEEAPAGAGAMDIRAWADLRMW